MDDLSQKRESKSTSFISVITLSSAGLGGSKMEKRPNQNLKKRVQSLEGLLQESVESCILACQRLNPFLPNWVRQNCAGVSGTFPTETPLASPPDMRGGGRFSG